MAHGVLNLPQEGRREVLMERAAQAARTGDRSGGSFGPPGGTEPAIT